MAEASTSWKSSSGDQPTEAEPQDFTSSALGQPKTTPSKTNISSVDENSQGLTNYDGPTVEVSAGGHSIPRPGPSNRDLCYEINSPGCNSIGGYFVYSLEAPTSGFARKGESSLTYLNKDQYYNVHMEFVSYPQSTGNVVHFVAPEALTSLISLQFSQKEKQSRNEAIKCWEIWSARQPVANPQALSVLSKISPNRVSKVQTLACNGVKVSWTPYNGAVIVKVAVKCLSTDFTNQKGVKGIPLFIQIDTFENEVLRDRAVAQIKTFSDKGADRKFREEERRLARMPLPYPCQQIKLRTLFQHVTNLMVEPVLFGSVPDIKEEPTDQFDDSDSHPADQPQPMTSAALAKPSSLSSSSSVTPSKPDRGQNNTSPNETGRTTQFRRQSRVSATVTQPQPQPIYIFVRQETEEIFTALSLAQPTLDLLIKAIAKKYQVESGDIRHVYKRSYRGYIVYVDDEYVQGLAGGYLLMKILVVQGSDPKPQFDIVLCELVKP